MLSSVEGVNVCLHYVSHSMVPHNNGKECPALNQSLPAALWHVVKHSQQPIVGTSQYLIGLTLYQYHSITATYYCDIHSQHGTTYHKRLHHCVANVCFGLTCHFTDFTTNT